MVLLPGAPGVRVGPVVDGGLNNVATRLARRGPGGPQTSRDHHRAAPALQQQHQQRVPAAGSSQSRVAATYAAGSALLPSLEHQAAWHQQLDGLAGAQALPGYGLPLIAQPAQPRSGSSRAPSSGGSPAAPGCSSGAGASLLPEQLLRLADAAAPVALPPPRSVPPGSLDNRELDKLVGTLGRSKATWRRALVLSQWLQESGHVLDDRLCTTSRVAAPCAAASALPSIRPPGISSSTDCRLGGAKDSHALHPLSATMPGVPRAARGPARAGHVPPPRRQRPVAGTRPKSRDALKKPLSRARTMADPAWQVRSSKAAPGWQPPLRGVRLVTGV